MYSTPEGYSQATNRSFRIFTDQHGRVWGADIENATQAPCGPISAKFKSPLRIASKYVKLADALRGVLHIDYDHWLTDLDEAHRNYLSEVVRQKRRMSPAQPHLIKDDNPDLLLVVGEPPPPIEQVQAALSGNRWVLGISNPDTGKPEIKPDWAEEYFPEPVTVAVMEFPNFEGDYPDVGAFPDEEQEREAIGDEPGETAHAEEPEEVTVTAGESVPEGRDESWDEQPTD